jgi:hypothetical protein
MIINFDEDKFIKEIVNFYINNDISYNHKNYSLFFDIFFTKMTKAHNCKLILENYCTKEEIEDAKERYKDDYVELKLSLILYNKFLNTLYKEKIYLLYLDILY